MDAAKIALMINDIYDGVERSKIGPIVSKVGEQTIINNVPMSAFMTILSAASIKNIIMEEKRDF